MINYVKLDVITKCCLLADFLTSLLLGEKKYILIRKYVKQCIR